MSSKTSKALVVEDCPVFCCLLKGLVAKHFPHVCVLEAGTIAEGREALERECPELILMDIGLPDGNGLDLTREIKTADPAKTVILLTSHDFPEYREAAERYGADHFMPKGSFTANEFVTILGSALGLSSVALANASA